MEITTYGEAKYYSVPLSFEGQKDADLIEFIVDKVFQIIDSYKPGHPRQLVSEFVSDSTSRFGFSLILEIPRLKTEKFLNSGHIVFESRNDEISRVLYSPAPHKKVIDFSLT